MIHLIVKGFKHSVLFTLSLLPLLSLGAIFTVLYFSPNFNLKGKLPKPLGTVVSSYNQLKQPTWQSVSKNFDFFVIEYQFNYSKPFPKLLRWCQYKNCWAHNAQSFDDRTNGFKTFTVADFWTHNRIFYNTNDWGAVLDRLNFNLKNMPSGSTVVFSEYEIPLSQFNYYQNFIQSLIVRYPHLKFIIGLQVHLQWVDRWWFRNYSIFDKLDKSGLPWMISEFSVYDEIYMQGIPDWILRVDRFIPHFIRQSFSLWSAYNIASACRQYLSCQAFVLWGNYPFVWHERRLQPDYTGRFTVFDFQGQSTEMYTAILRGLSGQ